MRGRLLALLVVLGLVGVALPAAPAAAASPVVELVERLVPAHVDLDLARDGFARVRAVAGDGSARSRDAARHYADASDDFAARTAAVTVRSGEERALRDAMAGAARALATDLRAYASGAIGGAELDRRMTATRARSAERIAALVPAVAAQQGLDDPAGAHGVLTGVAPVLLFVIGVVALAAFTRRRNAARRSPTR